MSNYPEKTCEIEKLVTNPKLVQAVLAGRKTQQRRNGVYAYPGEEFELEGKKFKVTSLESQKLGEMTNEDAQAEGFPSLEFYKDLILKMHKGMKWDEDSAVWVHEFEVA